MNPKRRNGGGHGRSRCSGGKQSQRSAEPAAAIKAGGSGSPKREKTGKSPMFTVAFAQDQRPIAALAASALTRGRGRRSKPVISARGRGCLEDSVKPNGAAHGPAIVRKPPSAEGGRWPPRRPSPDRATATKAFSEGAYTLTAFTPGAPPLCPIQTLRPRASGTSKAMTPRPEPSRSRLVERSCQGLGDSAGDRVELGMERNSLILVERHRQLPDFQQELSRQTIEFVGVNRAHVVHAIQSIFETAIGQWATCKTDRTAAGV